MSQSRPTLTYNTKSNQNTKHSVTFTDDTDAFKLKRIHRRSLYCEAHNSNRDSSSIENNRRQFLIRAHNQSVHPFKEWGSCRGAKSKKALIPRRPRKSKISCWSLGKPEWRVVSWISVEKKHYFSIQLFAIACLSYFPSLESCSASSFRLSFLHGHSERWQTFLQLCYWRAGGKGKQLSCTGHWTLGSPANLAEWFSWTSSLPDCIVLSLLCRWGQWPLVASRLYPLWDIPLLVWEAPCETFINDEGLAIIIIIPPWRIILFFILFKIIRVKNTDCNDNSGKKERRQRHLCFVL